MTANKLKMMCAALLLGGIATYFAGCSKDENNSSSSSSNSSSFIPTESAVMAKLKNFSFASTSTTTTSEAQKILTFLGSDVDIHTVTSAPGVICGEYKSGYHLALVPGGAAYAAYYGDEDDHSFLTMAGTAFTIDPATAGGGGGSGTGTGAMYAIFYYDGSSGNPDNDPLEIKLNGTTITSTIGSKKGSPKYLHYKWSSKPSCSTSETFDTSYFGYYFANIIKVTLTKASNTWSVSGATVGTGSGTKTFTASPGCNLIRVYVN